jgi:hypothetical protein
MERELTAEELRLKEAREREAHWKRWGPYLSERAWGTVREDYSAGGAAWEYFPHEHARSRAFRWSEDGIAGISDRHQRICFSLALWNGRDPILKERMFGLTGNEGNHGEDVKELYYYLDSTPTHSYMRYLYKYPQAEFPYARLVEENRRRDKNQPEFELMDTGIFDDNRYFDVFVEYAKAGPDDILIRIEAANRGPEEAEICLIPTLWYRNTWSWGQEAAHPVLGLSKGNRLPVVEMDEPYYGNRWLYCDDSAARPEMLFTENETNVSRVFGGDNPSPHVKDAFHDYLIHGMNQAVNPEQTGTKAAAVYRLKAQPGQGVSIRLRLTNREFNGDGGQPFDDSFDATFVTRKQEADAFYSAVIPANLSDDGKNVMRQALGGMLWSKQFYHFDVRTWLNGDPAQPAPPESRRHGRNHGWQHLYNADVISMPDKWEYPWFAAWDLAFHCVPLAIVDSDFAKEQLVLLLREWYMHPNGQLPAYEWAFGDVNPPVHAWATLRVYQIEKKRRGRGDRHFLERVFHKLLLNFTWWVNRKDADGLNIFQGGFLGMDNIGVFDRSAPLPTGGYIEQSDGTSWMAMYCLNMLAIAMELSREEHSYEDVASKFWEHFCYISHAMCNRGEDGVSLWDEEDGFFYDVLKLSDGQLIPLKIRSMVGLIPLFAVETLEHGMVEKLHGFKRRLEWFVEHRPDLTQNLACMMRHGVEQRRLLSILDRDKLRRVLSVMLDESEFLSPGGIRALSRRHLDHPYLLQAGGATYEVKYEPAESSTSLFGGNSNWRGPVWFPANYLLIEALQKFHFYYGDDFKVECPTGSGNMMDLWEVSQELAGRMARNFLRGADGRRPVHGADDRYKDDPNWRDLVLFYEYFHGDTGRGVGASHQTGWTGVIAKLLQQGGEYKSHSTTHHKS